MKLSNKILIGFFGFLFLYLTAVFAEIRLRGTPNIIDDSNSIAETVDMPGIAYLVLHDLDESIAVVASDQPRLEVRSFSGNLLHRVKYNVSGDTLTLSQLQSQDIRPVKITVFIPKTALQGMRVDSALATVKGFQLEHLYISQNAGHIRMSDNRIRKMHVEASGRSDLSISEIDIDTLSAQIEESQVHISSSIKRLEGSMKSNSFLRLHDVDEIQFEKDKTSRLNWYQ